MKLNTLSVSPTSSNTPYYTINEVIRDYYAGKPVMVRGYGPLMDQSIDQYDAPQLKDMGYTHVEFRLGGEYREVVL